MSLLVLGIESSCDETAVAVVRDDRAVLSSLISSQVVAHRPFGGVVPELAARQHLDVLDTLVEHALQEAQVTLEEVDLVAATAGPGLIGGLIVGVTYGRCLAAAQSKPFYGINHLEGHALTARLTHGVAFPYLLLLVSGGHTQLVWVDGVGTYTRLGTTLDDAAGECFDKTAKLLGLGYPGGPALEKAAQGGDAARFPLPRPMAGHASGNFSFSGLKTAVRHKVVALGAGLTEDDRRDLAAGVQAAIADSLKDRVAHALTHLSSCGKTPSALVVAGGVAANAHIRQVLETGARNRGVAFVAPPLSLCGDNAAMIAWAGLERRCCQLGPEDDGHPRPRWSLGNVHGPGTL